MILIADSGSTKTDWYLVKNNTVFKDIATIGLNPLHITDTAFIQTAKDALADQQILDISHVYFYGAGCSSLEMQNRVSGLLSNIFSHAAVEVESDLLGAARGLGGFESCIVGIIGTGSHAGMYNGKVLTELAPSLGYILGDEGSGIYLGKQLLRDFFYRTLPLHLLYEFKQEYHLEKDDCLNHIYIQHKGASYIASYSSFIVKHKKEPYFEKMIKEGFTSYIENILMPLSPVVTVPVHFTGSIACIFQDELKSVLEDKRLLPGKFIQKPIEGLVYFHTQQYSH